ncbi:MAG: hypothetical protein HYR85_00515 [Planctomycetes bacterium]|nr:hypothetical protein [Planctomycetota bacterium]MBI3847531.1 hypothetical protein [Planctomycetota bacterium]
MICFYENRKYPRLDRSYPIQLTSVGSGGERERIAGAGTTINVSARGLYLVNYTYAEIFRGMTCDILITVPNALGNAPYVCPINLRGTGRIIRVDHCFSDLVFTQKVALQLAQPLQFDRPSAPCEETRAGQSSEVC